MSAHVEVLSTDLRRAKVKVTPGTYLIDILSEACEKLKLSSDKYLLKYKNKNVDLTGTYRTSGLSPGAKLDLVMKSTSPSVVNVGLAVAGRAASMPQLTKQLRSDMTLWQMLRQFEDLEKGLDLTARGKPGAATSNGQLYWEEPVLNIMGKEYASLSDLQKTLSQCGINGGNMRIRVDFRTSSKTLYDAMKDISEYLKEVEPEKATEAAPAATAPAPVSTEQENVPAKAPEQSAPLPEAMDVDTAEQTLPESSTSEKPADPLQPAGVFSAPASSTPAAARTLEDDSVYEPTIAHAQLRQTQLQERSHNTRLKSDAELRIEAAEKAARLAKVTEILIKVRFPDQTVAQWRVGPDTDGAFLYQAIRGIMANADAPFKLIEPGPAGATIRDDTKKLVKGYGLTTSTLLNLVWEDGASAAVRKAAFLKSSVASQAKDIAIPKIPQGEAED
ncbi:hypothetical protein GQ53DRAFT_596904, partial [Thozetella sp. PMI_491]